MRLDYYYSGKQFTSDTDGRSLANKQKIQDLKVNRNQKKGKVSLTGCFERVGSEQNAKAGLEVQSGAAAVDPAVFNTVGQLKRVRLGVEDLFG